jgi:hypothetical protein
MRYGGRRDSKRPFFSLGKIEARGKPCGVDTLFDERQQVV